MWLTPYCSSTWRVWSASCWVTLLRDAAPKVVLVLMCALRPNGCVVMAIFFLLFALMLCRCSGLNTLAACGGRVERVGGDTPRPGRGLRPCTLCGTLR